MSVPAAALHRLRARLTPAAAALPFAEAVLRQLASGAGALADAPDAEAEALADRIAVLLLEVDAPASDLQVARLAAEPALASALFQNLDLLYLHPWPGADGVGLLLARLLEAVPEGG